MNSLTKHHKKLRKLVRVIGTLSIIFTIIAIYYLFKNLDILNNPKALSHLLKGHRFLGSIGFLFLQIIQVVIPIIPGGLTTVVGFMTFGPYLGLLLNVLGISLGSLILFYLVRRFGRPFILLFIKEKQLRQYDKKLATKTYERIFILNMISPMAPADIMVMITGLSQMSLKRFVSIILICRPISMITYSYFWIYGGQMLRHLL
ncbi:TVP38/TMEM64 family protein [Streptococcus urinalis]|uniref:TVP38/TMEM64 family membrane protein n=1 Tax=Streptococcus urinalis 2285-97 TaxID=764291 RepID=G5KFD1_9STRE|nr:VTT domain-containing protein [Streptococcus urinalis]EHJ56408.1 SNARE-like domain protein [Streptococcus urinalis 2285-97]VEF31845.1 membrane protein [Streptococcus urinalis]